MTAVPAWSGALERANYVRTARSEFRRKAKEGSADPAAVVANPPDWARTMKIIDAVLAKPKVGKVTGHKLLRRADVPPTKQLCALTPRQRSEVVGLLR